MFKQKRTPHIPMWGQKLGLSPKLMSANYELTFVHFTSRIDQFFYVLLTVRLSIILAINQSNAQNFLL